MRETLFGLAFGMGIVFVVCFLNRTPPTDEASTIPYHCTQNMCLPPN